MKTFLLTLSMSFFLFFSSCNEQESTVLTTKPPSIDKTTLAKYEPCDPVFRDDQLKKTYDSLFKGRTYDLVDIPDVITPRAVSCDYIQHAWLTYEYKPKAGKLVGVWPYDRSEPALINLKNRYGYSGIFCGNSSQYKQATSPNIGFSKEKVMLSVSFNPGHPEQYINKIQNYDAGFYYIDEPTEHKCWPIATENRTYNPDELYSVYNKVHEVRPNSKFAIGGYKRCFHFQFAGIYSDIVMYTAYSNWNNVSFACSPTGISWGPPEEPTFVQGSSDQRDSWSDMRNIFGSKFSMTWINTHKDLGDFDYLLGHAQNKGLNGVWIYCLDGHHTDQFENISYAAWSHGFLRRWVQDVKFTWKCSISGPCACNPACFPQDYYLYSVEYGTIKEVLP